MLWDIMTIIFWLSIGLMVGVIIMSVIANSGYRHKCDNCMLVKLFELWGEDDE